MRYLRDSLQIRQAGYHDTITVRAPDENETRFFRLPEDGRISVIETRRTAFRDDGSAIRLTMSVYPADRNQFALNVGKVPDDVADPPSAAGDGADDPPTEPEASG